MSDWGRGFFVLPGPIVSASLTELTRAYDAAVEQASVNDVKIGSTTTRVSDVINEPVFDEIYLHARLLEICQSVIGQPFKLSDLLARTLRPNTPAQNLHVDFASDAKGWPMVGFILMIDDFTPENGATLFLPGSQGLPAPPENCELVPACGPAGSMIVFNGSIWHGHGPNRTEKPRRSIQGAYIRRTERSGFDLPSRIRSETLARLSPMAKHHLGV